jgi:hypothetical protein
MTAILSFLGSAVFRWLLEKVFSVVERKQDHEQEMASIKLQAEVDAANHIRNLEMLEIQSRLKLDLIKEETRGAFEAAEGAAFVESIRNAKATGIRWLDGWNGAIRPFVSTVCVMLWFMSLVNRDFSLQEFDLALIGSVIGWHFGTRSLMPGKK